MITCLTKALLYGFAVSVTAILTLLADRLNTIIAAEHPQNVAIPLYFVGVLISAWFCHLGPGLLAAGLSYVTVDYFFIPPIDSFDLAWDHMPLLSSFLLTATVVDLLNKRRWRAKKALDLSNEQMRVAQRIQERLVPGKAPELPDFDIAGASYPAEATGGDYYDYIPMRGGAIGIVLGDVSGHGFGPALLMAETRAYLRALVLTHEDVGEILTLTNRLLATDTDSDRFMTLFFARFDPRSRSIIYAGAGHEAYLLGSSGKTRKLQSTSFPLGLDEDLVVSCAPALDVLPGEILLVISDGFSEAQARAGELFGMPRIIEIVHANRSKTAREIIEVLLHAIRDYTQGHKQDDDMTVAILKSNVAD